MQAAKLQEYQKVDVLNINNGERFQTYVIKGESGSGVICINGAAARKAQKGDKVIIVSYAYFKPYKMDGFEPTVVLVDDSNKIIEKE